MSNVNNLNGIPNFGHGFPEETEEVINSAEAIDEAEETVETKPTKKKK